MTTSTASAGVSTSASPSGNAAAAASTAANAQASPTPASPSSAKLRRNRPGTKAADFCAWPEESFEEMDSTLAVQQVIQQSIRRYVTLFLVSQKNHLQFQSKFNFSHFFAGM